MDRERVAQLVRDIEQIEEESICLFASVPLRPAERLEQPNGEVIVLRWFPDTDAKAKSRDVTRRYKVWYRSSLKLIEEFLPYQEGDFKATYDIMLSYVTLNRYAATTEHVIAKVEKTYERGYVDIYLNEFAQVIDSQADLLRSLLYLQHNGDPPSYRCFLTGLTCTRPLRENPKLVFVLMPFDHSYDDLYQFGIKETVRDLGLQCQRADEIVHTQNVMCRAICQPIRAARYVIADITDPNPNVFYELGLTHGRAEDIEQLNKRAILLTKNIASAPFDLRNMNIVQYDSIGSLRTELKAVLIALTAELEDDAKLEPEANVSSEEASPFG
jgi:hypothetical protein